MKVVYAGQDPPDAFDQSIFLVGPTPRDKFTKSWRPDAIAILKTQGYKGVVFVPEPENGIWTTNYDSQIKWEKDHLNMSDIILAWIPRTLESMPAFTSNVEFGLFIKSGKLVYGRPEGTPHIGYLDHTYKEVTGHAPDVTLEKLVETCLNTLPYPAMRERGERSIPLHIWHTEMFQEWILAQKTYGNFLHKAEVLWNFIPGNFVFSFIIKVNVWIHDERRYKSNEFILSRPDIACVIPYKINKLDVMKSVIYFVEEFRSPVRNHCGMVRELPGGSSTKKKPSLQVATSEINEEMGLDIREIRLKLLGQKQIASTLSTHKCTVYGLELTDEEVILLDAKIENKSSSGITDDSEVTFVTKFEFGNLIDNYNIDWANIGMISKVIIPTLLKKDFQNVETANR